MASGVLNRAERIQIENECMLISVLHSDYRSPALELLCDLVQDPSPVKRIYELRVQAIYQQAHRRIDV